VTGRIWRAAAERNAKKRAVVAVARKLVVLMHRIWITQEAYDPMRGVRVRPAA
jgi:transposase